MIDIPSIAEGLCQSGSGVWYSIDTSVISYPDDGNEVCMAVEDSSFWFQHRNRIICSLVKQFPPSGFVLEVGAGNGIVAKALSGEGFDIIALEPGESGVRNMQKRGLTQLICSTLEDARLKDGMVPAFALFDVLEHIEDDIAFLKQMKHKLVKNGLIYLTVPAYNFLWSAEDDNSGHFRRYTKKLLNNRFTDTGFRIIYSSYFFSFLMLPIFCVRTIPSLFSFRKKTTLKRTQKEHSATSKFIIRVVDSLCKYELGIVDQGARLAYGTSIFVVAESVDNL